MVTIKASYNNMKELIGEDVTVAELDELLSFAKSEIDDYVREEDMLEINVKTSNRPDLWCPEGLVREIKGILGKEKAIPSLSIKPSGYKVKVDPKLASSRPYIACAVAKNLHLSDYIIKQFMQLSDKIDYSYGRKRKKASIGLYNLSMIKSPIDYKVIEKTHHFVPLGYDKEMNLEEILEHHEKGLEYGYIVREYGHYPILLSSDGVTLSLPPIINSNTVGRITEETKECLIEVTGTNFETVNVELNILCQTLADRGAEIFSVEIVYPQEIHKENVITPELTKQEIIVDLDIINKYLGTEITPSTAIKILEKRRFEGKSLDTSKINVIIPPYRLDILHWVDIAEEIVIGLDYNKVGATKWHVLTTGGLSQETEGENKVRDILIGTGAVEILTNTLTDSTILTDKVNLDDDSFVKIGNAVSKSYSVIRNQIYPNLISVLSKNTHESYPQIIFEVGEVVKIENEKPCTQTNLAYLYADAEASFEDAHKLLHRLMSLLNVEYIIESKEHPSFISGRCGIILVEGEKCGVIGEINPAVLEKNLIWVPVVGLELELFLLPSLSCKRKFTF